MIDVKALEREEFAAEYRASLKNRGEDPAWVDRLLALNARRKQIITTQEGLRAEQNKVGEEIARRRRAKEDAGELLTRMQGMAAQVKELEASVGAAELELNEAAAKLPNKLQASVPIGQSEDDNVLVRASGQKRTFAFQPKEHWQLGEELGMIDFERAGKVAGSRFAFLRGAVARLERALTQFMLDLHTREHGYEEIQPPLMVNAQAFYGTGQFPKFREDVFHVTGTDYALIPTAEVPVTNYYAQEILRAEDLPLRFTAFTPCFRSEAGSYGKDTRGLIRQHQFNKVELVVFAPPERSNELHEELTRHAERVLQLLELPYRVVALCSKDTGFGAAKTYDLEVWLPGQNAYREISSCTNFEDFQARRAGIRFKTGEAKAKTQFVHTINGSGLALGRTLVAVLENYQREDGSIDIPKALKPYLVGLEHIQK